MIAQKDCPLTIFRNGGRLLENIDDRITIFHMERHENSRHEREMKAHMAFVCRTEVGYGVFRPLIRFRQEHPVGVLCVNARPEFLENQVRFNEIFATCPFSLY